MSELIVNPEIPYIGNIPGKLEPGKMCRIQGVTLPQIDRFTVNLQTGPTPKPRDDTALHISVRIKQGYIARNSYINGEWGDEDGTGRLPIGPAQSFEILILIDARSYKVAVNGEHFCEFSHRIPIENVTHLLIEGDVNITLISWELSVPVIQNQQSQSAVSTNASQQQNLPPTTQPQGPYGGPPQYGPPPQFGPPQYGPPGPQEEQSGFGGFLEQAQEALVGAIKSGAAEKLLSGLLSTGGQQPQQQQQGYAPQNANYGQYPGPPQQQQQQHQSHGPLESLLSGILPSGNTQQHQQQPNIPQVGGQGSVGGLGSMGGILSNLAGQILHNPKGN